MIKFQGKGTPKKYQRLRGIQREGATTDKQGTREFGRQGRKVKQIQTQVGIRSA